MKPNHATLSLGRNHMNILTAKRMTHNIYMTTPYHNNKYFPNHTQNKALQLNIIANPNKELDLNLKPYT
jgi:hypothetical protein